MDGQTIAINFSDSRDNHALFGVEAPTPSERLAECAERHRVEVSLALAALLTGHGAFAIYRERYDGTTFLELFPRFRTLPAAVKDNFGTLFPFDQLIEYLYFDRQGNFGRLRYRDDDWLATQREAKAVLMGATEPACCRKPWITPSPCCSKTTRSIQTKLRRP